MRNALWWVRDKPGLTMFSLMRAKSFLRWCRFPLFLIGALALSYVGYAVIDSRLYAGFRKPAIRAGNSRAETLSRQPQEHFTIVRRRSYGRGEPEMKKQTLPRRTKPTTLAWGGSKSAPSASLR